jgi:hypothetical protein
MTIDTLDYVKKLEAAGVPRVQAEAHAAAVRDTLAAQLPTKADLDAAEARLDAKLDMTTARLEAQIDRVEQKFDGKFLLLQWMLVFNLLFTSGVLLRMLLQ